MVTKTQADIAWKMFAQLVQADVQVKDMARKWHDMSKQSSQKRLLSQKQNSLRKGGVV